MLPKGVLSPVGDPPPVPGSDPIPSPTASQGLGARDCVSQDGVSVMPPPEPFPP